MEVENSFLNNLSDDALKHPKNELVGAIKSLQVAFSGQFCSVCLVELSHWPRYSQVSKC